MVLTIFNLNLRVDEAGELSSWNVRAMQRALLDACDLEEDGNQQRPYTLGILGSAENYWSPLVTCNQGQSFSLRLTTLNQAMYSKVANQLIPRWQAGFGVGDSRLTLLDYNVEQTEYQSLFGQIQAKRPLSQRIYLSFRSPTAFRQTGGTTVILPLPEYVFGSLANRWQTFSPFPLHPDTRQFAKEIVQIESYNLKTVTVDTESGTPLRGFTGHATYRATRSDTFWLEQLHVLVEFSRFGGMGVRTTAGMGQVMLKPRPSRHPDRNLKGQ